MMQNIQIPSEQEIKDELVKMLEEGLITREEAAQKLSAYRKIQSGAAPLPTVGAPQEPVTPVATQIRPQPSIGERVLGDVQALGNVATGMISEPVAGLSGLAVGAITGDSGQAAQAVENVQNFGTSIIPKNPTAEKRLEQAGGLMDKAIAGVRFPVSGIAGIVAGLTPGGMGAAEAVEAVQKEGISDVLGESVLNLTGNEEAATVAYTLPQATLEAIGIKNARALKGETFSGAESAMLSTNKGQALMQASPQVTQLKKRAQELYRAVDDSGAQVKDIDFLDFALEVNELMMKNGFDPRVADTLSPKAKAVLQVLHDSVGDPLSFTEMDNLRKMANVAANDVSNPLEAALGSLIKGEIDNFIDSQAAKMIRAGDTGAEAGKQLKQARNLWQRARKAEMLDEVFLVAEDQASGFENGLRIGLRSILRNEKKRKSFSADEVKLMREIVNGTGIANTFKRLGKLGIGEGQQTNMLLASLAAGGGYATSGPFGAVALPAIGTVSGRLATRLTKNKSKFLNDIVRAGDDGQAIVDAYMKNTPASSRNVTELTELLMQSGADVSSVTSKAGFVQDALYAAEYLTNVGAANFIELPAFISATERLTEEEEQ